MFASKFVSSMALLLLSAQDVMSGASAIWAGPNGDQSCIRYDLIDLEADVREVDPEVHHTGGLGTQLMNLAAESGVHPDYIDK